jgi:hypothetical protein
MSAVGTDSPLRSRVMRLMRPLISASSAERGAVDGDDDEDDDDEDEDEDEDEEDEDETVSMSDDDDESAADKEDELLQSEIKWWRNSWRLICHSERTCDDEHGKQKIVTCDEIACLKREMCI